MASEADGIKSTSLILLSEQETTVVLAAERTGGFSPDHSEMSTGARTPYRI